MTVRFCKFKGLAEGEIVCKFCAHQGENCLFKFDEDDFAQKCCENCKYANNSENYRLTKKDERKCRVINTKIRDACGKSKLSGYEQSRVSINDYCSDGKPKEEK